MLVAVTITATPDTKALADGALKGNKDLRAALATLAGMPKDNDAFLAELAELEAAAAATNLRWLGARACWKPVESCARSATLLRFPHQTA